MAFIHIGMASVKASPMMVRMVYAVTSPNNALNRLTRMMGTKNTMSYMNIWSLFSI